MNFDDAEISHFRWKISLCEAIESRFQLDADTLSRDNCCDLGQWLHGAAKNRYGSLRSFRECVAAHARFHEEAGRTARLINDKRYAEATQEIAGVEYAAASERTITTIRILKGEVQKILGPHALDHEIA